jgi:hypothetical protein
MFEKCAYIENGYYQKINTEREMLAPDYLSNILVPFMDTQFHPCPALPVIPTAVPVKIWSTDRFSTEDQVRAHVKEYCDALQKHFYNYTNALVMTDSPKLECEGFNITFLESLEKPNTHTSPAQEILCGLRYIAQYPVMMFKSFSDL